jgi:hypothetical protein
LTPALRGGLNALDEVADRLGYSVRSGEGDGDVRGVVLVALLMGFRSGAGALAWLAVAGILSLFTLALTWIAVIPGLSAKSVDRLVVAHIFAMVTYRRRISP